MIHDGGGLVVMVAVRVLRGFVYLSREFGMKGWGGSIACSPSKLSLESIVPYLMNASLRGSLFIVVFVYRADAES